MNFVICSPSSVYVNAGIVYAFPRQLPSWALRVVFRKKITKYLSLYIFYNKKLITTCLTKWYGRSFVMTPVFEGCCSRFGLRLFWGPVPAEFTKLTPVNLLIFLKWKLQILCYIKVFQRRVEEELSPTNWHWKRWYLGLVMT